MEITKRITRRTVILMCVAEILSVCPSVCPHVRTSSIYAHTVWRSAIKFPLDTPLCGKDFFYVIDCSWSLASYSWRDFRLFCVYVFYTQCLTCSHQIFHDASRKRTTLGVDHPQGRSWLGTVTGPLPQNRLAVSDIKAIRREVTIFHRLTGDVTPMTIMVSYVHIWWNILIKLDQQHECGVSVDQWRACFKASVDRSRLWLLLLCR